MHARGHSVPFRHLLAAVSLTLLLTALAPAVSPARGATSPAALPPFAAPASWSTACTTQRPEGTRLARGTNCRWLSLDGVWRRYLVYVPVNKAFTLQRRWPVVLMFHGNGGTGEKMWDESGWREQAESVGSVVAFPTAWRYERTFGAKKTRWNTWKLPYEIKRDVRLDGYPDDAPYPARDLLFVRRMLDDVGGALAVDDQRVFASGFSNGGKFVVRVGASLSTRVAAVTCAGYCDAPPSWYVAKRNISLLYGLGTRDTLVLSELAGKADPVPSEIPLPWPEARPIVWPMLAGHLATWRLDPDALEVVASATRTRVTWQTPRDGNTDGNDGKEFRFVLFGGLAHSYPASGHSTVSGGMAGISWAFFVAHPLR